VTACDFDLFTIGAGSGGVRASRVAAGLGAKVAIAEEHRAGGTCVIRGCVPKKLLTYAAHYAEDFADAAGYGWTVPQASFSWPTLIANKNKEIARLEAIYRNLLVKSGVIIMDGRARLVGPHAVEVAGKRYTARHVLVATGGWPMRPDVPGAEHGITSNEAFELPALPRRVLMVGAGYIGLEFAGIFHGLGADVTVAYRGSEILRGFDDDIRKHLHAELTKKGIDIRVNTDLASIERRADGTLIASLTTAEGVRQHETDAVMFATGRWPNTNGLGLVEHGVKLDEHGAVMVDALSCSNVPGIHAIGDVTNRLALTPVAIREGAAFAATIFGGKPTAMDHRDVPQAVFSNPTVCVVGMTESEALLAHDALEIYKTTFRPMKHTLTERDERTLMKLVVDQASQRVLGAHMVGPDAPEIIQGIAIAVKMRLTKADLDSTVAIHPTAAEEFVTLRDPMVVRRR
jgi:glutathione reductase (NADPH)